MSFFSLLVLIELTGPALARAGGLLRRCVLVRLSSLLLGRPSARPPQLPRAVPAVGVHPALDVALPRPGRPPSAPGRTSW